MHTRNQINLHVICTTSNYPCHRSHYPLHTVYPLNAASYAETRTAGKLGPKGHGYSDPHDPLVNGLPWDVCGRPEGDLINHISKCRWERKRKNCTFGQDAAHERTLLSSLSRIVTPCHGVYFSHVVSHWKQEAGTKLGDDRDRDRYSRAGRGDGGPYQSLDKQRGYL
jgi:hypothetical protein